MDFQLKQVDVFAGGSFTGSPVSVVFDANGLDSQQMQQIAKWTNLFATTFVLSPSIPAASYQVRFFTPRAEVPFAGYPAIGTAHALLEASVVRANSGKLIQQCAAGLITLSIADHASAHRLVTFDLPDARLRTLGDIEVKELECALGVTVTQGYPVKMVDIGHRRVAALRGNMMNYGEQRIVAQIKSTDALSAVTPNLQRLKDLCVSLGAAGVTIFAIQENGAARGIEVRSFSTAQDMAEEPVRSHIHGAVAAYVRSCELTAVLGPIFKSEQRARGGMYGIVHVEIANTGPIRIGGKSVTRIDGCVYDQ
jgi:PhzF family phenazine biosynthesis protein